jgi:outer membrane protein TolC
MRSKVLAPIRSVIAVSTLAIAGGVAPVTTSAQDRPPVTIGVLTDGPLGRFAGLVDLIERETVTLLESRYDVSIGPATTISGDRTLAGTRGALDQLLGRADVDIIVAVGQMAAHVAARHPALTKPIVAPFVLDPSLQDIPRAGAASGVTNFVYLTRPQNRDLETLAEVVDIDHLAVLAGAATLEELPASIERIRAAVREAGATAVAIPVSDDVEATLAAIEAAEADAVYVLPAPQLSDAAFVELANGLIRLGLPSMSWFGEPEVEQGILLGRRPDSFIFQLARLTALAIQDILRGDEAGQLRITFVPQEQVIVNMRTARAIGVYPTWTMLSDARLIDEAISEEAEAMTLDSVVREALAQNQDLAAFDRAVRAAAQDVKLATSRLLPQLDLAFTGSVIDEDRAAASFGILPQRLLLGSVGLSQVVYSDRAWADRTVQQSLQRAREEDYATLRLDVSFEAADAYLTIRRRKADERIRRENLAFTRANLDLAEVRRQTGAATPGEVLRWQAQVAQDRQGVVVAVATRQIAETRLQRLLHRPLREALATPATDFEDPVMQWAEDALLQVLDDPRAYEGFQEFMVAEALAASPELRALDAIIGGQERALAAAKRAFWLPEFFLGAEVSNWLATGGAGSGITPGLEQDPWRWSIQLSARYLIFGGGSRAAAKTQAEESLFSLEYQRTATQERVDQEMRDALQLLISSRIQLELAREAAEAAGGNFALVRTAYAGGVAGILNLLDAQTTALFADLDAATALYDFISDFMLVQRAAGRMDLFMDDTVRAEFVDRLATYLREIGVR